MDGMVFYSNESDVEISAALVANVNDERLAVMACASSTFVAYAASSFATDNSWSAQYFGGTTAGQHNVSVTNAGAKCSGTL